MKTAVQITHSGLCIWWAPRESNSAPTDYAYQLRFSPPLSGLWSGLSLVFTTCPYSLYTFSLLRASLGIATVFTPEVSPNLSNSTEEQSELTPKQPISRPPYSMSRRGSQAKSAALTKHELEALKLQLSHSSKKNKSTSFRVIGVRPN